MKANEFSTLIKGVKNAATTAEIDMLREELFAHVDENILTVKQTEKWHEAINARLLELNESKGAQDMADKQESKNEVAKVEVSTKQIDAATEKKINTTVTRVEKQVKKIENGYLSIIGDVAYLKESNAHKVTGHKNFYELCADKFGMSRGSVHNILTVYEHFGENYALKDEYKEMTLRQMLAQIKNENDASKLLESNEAGDGEVLDGDGDGESADKQESKKRVTIVDFDFTCADEWTVDAVIEKMRTELEKLESSTLEAGAHVTFTIDV